MMGRVCAMCFLSLEGFVKPMYVEMAVEGGTYVSMTYYELLQRILGGECKCIHDSILI